ncbi:TIGR02301 family protein [Lutibaculum baratangense]|uniref:TIGR02301 family protein n=1 Tax=Lutibaculum baratangense AMV1 TaxID=631454 RepID=V4RHC3_9HYPH|nr:TIGR02301 family protein [Lutibaculum baratangense]ESR24759.1 hypothetical protein N177_2082 [Lutibaculum baratangense AMV1]
MSRLRHLLAILVLLAASLPAAANPADAPPYEKDLHRLAEILGAVHYLRELCEADEGQTWRSLMQQLIDAENPSPERRARLVNSFNRGYHGFQQSYRRCTETAVHVIGSYMDEGSEIAQRIASRYGR